MHEYSIIQALMDKVEEEARARGATAVHRLAIRVGEWSGVDPELLKTAYDTFRAGTICASASLELKYVKARWACRACKQPIPTGEPLQCAACGAPAQLSEGDEILLDQIELEVP